MCQNCHFYFYLPKENNTKWFFFLNFQLIWNLQKSSGLLNTICGQKSLHWYDTEKRVVLGYRQSHSSHGIKRTAKRKKYLRASCRNHFSGEQVLKYPVSHLSKPPSSFVGKSEHVLVSFLLQLPVINLWPSLLQSHIHAHTHKQSTTHTLSYSVSLRHTLNVFFIFYFFTHTHTHVHLFS